MWEFLNESKDHGSFIVFAILKLRAAHAAQCTFSQYTTQLIVTIGVNRHRYEQVLDDHGLSAE